MNYNVFLCYKGTESGLLAGKIYKELVEYTHNRIQIFYAPECIAAGMDFVEICQDVSGKVSLMILFVSRGFFDNIDSEENVVGNEIRSALNNKACKFLPIILPEGDINEIKKYDSFSVEDIYRITHINPIRYTDVYTFKSTQLLIPILEALALDESYIKNYSAIKNRTYIGDNSKSSFFSDKNSSEKERLIRQQALLYKYDNEVYNKLLNGKENIAVLDLGSGNGTTVMNRLGDRPEVEKIIGLEYDEVNVTHANEKYAGTKAVFYQFDIEAEDFVTRMKEIMELNGIKKFDFVNILAVISHLKNPAKMFRNLKKICKRDAGIIIRNIDDGYNIAYPDDEGIFAKALEIPSKLISCGYRYSGRQIYSMLVNAGYNNICLERMGITSVGMEYEEKETLFEIMFGFIMNGIKKEKDLTTDADIQALCEWYINIYDELEDSFLHNDFYFSLGFMIFSANM